MSWTVNVLIVIQEHVSQIFPCDNGSLLLVLGLQFVQGPMKIVESILGVGLWLMYTAMAIIPKNSPGKVKRARFEDQLFQVGRLEACKFLYISPITPLAIGHNAEPSAFVLARESPLPIHSMNCNTYWVVYNLFGCRRKPNSQKK
jgi:hypothetical protein